MVRFYRDLLAQYGDYANPKTKISRLVKAGKITKIISNIYEDDFVLDPFYYSSVIYNPSYISFDYALFLYGMIPERAVNVTCASFGKHKYKTYKTSLCNFYYQDVPERVYPFGVILNCDNQNYPFYIASKEKALLDKLYIIKGIDSISKIRTLLFLDLRIDEEIFYSLDPMALINIGSYYKTTTLNSFIKFVRKEKMHGKFIR